MSDFLNKKIKNTVYVVSCGTDGVCEDQIVEIVLTLFLFRGSGCN